MAAYNSSLGAEEYNLSLQLNAFLSFDHTGTRYVYWVQDVAELDTQTRALSFIDNVWNSTAVMIAPSAVSGNGSVVGTGPVSYYGYSPPCTIPGACLTLPNPCTFSLELFASLSPGGVPTVRFEFDDQGSIVAFDTVVFPWAAATSDFGGFAVDDALWSPTDCPRCYGDVEWVVGGSGYGYGTALDGPTEIVLALDWWNGNNFQAVPSASDYGVSTGETVSGATVSLATGSDGEPEANLTFGSGGLRTLWTEPQMAVVEVSVRTGSSGGSLNVSNGTVPYEGGFVEAIVVPGLWNLSVVSGGTGYPLGRLTLYAGEALTLEVGAPPVVFTPIGLPNGTVWSVTLAGQALSGTGNLTFGEAVGSYPFSVGPLDGYDASPASGNVSVTAAGADVMVRWTASAHGWLSALVGAIERSIALLLLIGLVIAAIALVIWAASRRSHRSGRRSALSPSPFVVKCPHCGGAVSPRASTCPECGRRLVSER